MNLYLDHLKDRYVVNHHYFNRYVKLMQFAMSRSEVLGYTERHHIAPTSLFKEFSRDKKNLVLLTGREHYIAHWLLAKSTKHKSCWYAFNMMRRVIVGENKRSVLYSLSRQYIKGLISENMKGRRMSDKCKSEMSKRVKNTVVVKNEEGETFRVSCSDKRYKEGALVFYRVGLSQSEETKRKIKENNGVRGKRPFHDPTTGNHRFEDRHPGEPWIEGYSNDYKKNMSETLKGCMFFHDPVTKKNMRCYSLEDVKEGYIPGRYMSTNPGFDKANSMVNVIDLTTLSCTKVEVVDKKIHAPASCVSAERTLMFVYKNELYTSRSSLQSKLRKEGIYVDLHSDIERLSSYRVKFHHNQTKKRQEFSKSNLGKSLSDLGIYFCKLKDYDYQRHLKLGVQTCWT